MSIYKSIAKNYAANTIGMAVRFLEQIAMVPLFISLWGIDKYADWILITALSSFFTMADMGLNSVTANEFVIKYQQKDLLTCLKLLANTFLFIATTGIIIIISVVIIAFTNGFNGLLQIAVFSEFETSVIFILLLFQVFVKMYSAVYSGIFRATSHAHTGTMIDNTIRLLEIAVLSIGIACKINILIVIIVYIAPACISIVYKHIYVQKWFKLKFSSKLFDKQLLKSLVKPSLAFMLMPLGFAISNQGLVFVINAALGSVVLVAFTTTRTLVNFLRQLMGLLANAAWPEISVAYGQKDKGTMANIYYRSLIITFITTVISIVILLFAGKYIYLTWTKHVVMFDSLFFTGMLFVLLVSCLWGLSSIIPLATNTHGCFSVAFLISQLAGILICYICLKLYPHLALIPVVLFTMELLLFLFTLKQNNRFMEINFSKLYKGLWQQTKFLIIKTKNCLQH